MSRTADHYAMWTHMDLARHAVELDAEVARLRGELAEVESYRRGLQQSKLMIEGLPLPKAVTAEMEDQRSALSLLRKFAEHKIAPGTFDGPDGIAWVKGVNDTKDYVADVLAGKDVLGSLATPAGKPHPEPMSVTPRRAPIEGG